MQVITREVVPSHIVMVWHLIKHVDFTFIFSLCIFCITTIPSCGLSYDFTNLLSVNGGPGSSVSIVTDYGLDGPRSNPGGDEIFPPIQTSPGTLPASCKMGTGSFPGGKVWPGHAANHSPPSSAMVMEE